MKSSKEIKKDKPEIHLIRGESPEGKQVYTYLLLHANMVRDMNLSLMTKTTDLNEYGIIIATGEGEPTEEIKEYIKDNFLTKG